MFVTYEKGMQELVKQARAPFLGLLGSLIPDTARAALADEVKANGDARAFGRRLEQYPALFGVWLAEHVMFGLGAAGHFDVYPHVRKAIGAQRDLTQDERLVLWRTFRRALVKLGIQPLARTRGTHFIVDEFVRQAGVPIAFVDDLARKMLSHAKRLGAPHEDDQEALLAWQTSLLSRLNPPFSTTARKAVERDTSTYYAQAFLRVLQNDGRATCNDRVEEDLSRAFVEEGGTAHIRRAGMPQLLYRDGVLGVLLPASQAPTDYQLTCGRLPAVTLRAEPGLSEFRPLASSLPQDVTLESPSGERLLKVLLWEDNSTNRLLIFNESGRLQASGRLNQEEEVSLSPGRYLAVCRFEPTKPEQWREVSQDPRLVEVPLELGPSEEVLLCNGPAQVSVVGADEPAFSLSGPSRSSLERLEFFYNELEATVVIPAEWRETASYRFELRVSTTSGRAAVASVELDEEGRGKSDLRATIHQLLLPAGMYRLVIELARSGDTRALQRKSVLFWSGLRQITYGLRFEYEQRPTNLHESGCLGLRCEQDVAEPTNQHGRTVRLAFSLGNGRLLHFTWNRPGLFVDVETPTPDGSVTRIPRPLGTTETVSLTQPKSIVVSGSEPGRLLLGSWNEYVDFTHHPSRVLSGAFLASRMQPGGNALVFRSESGMAEVPLLRLSQPHVFTALNSTRAANMIEVTLRMRGEPTEVTVLMRDLASDRVLRASLPLESATWHSSDIGRCMAYAASSGGASTSLHLQLDLLTVKSGLWIAELETRVNGIWGRVQDEEQGAAFFTLLLGGQSEEIAGRTLVQEVTDLEPREVIERLGRIDAHFNRQWAQGCSARHAWMRAYWNALVDRCKGVEAQFISRLVGLATASATCDARPGWFPACTVGARLPAVFALHRRYYAGVGDRDHPLALALKCAASLKSSFAQAFGEYIHPVAAAAFANFAEVTRGLRPRAFCLERYASALASAPVDAPYLLDDESFKLPPGELLGPSHLTHAWIDLARRYAQSLLIPSADRNAALGVARALHQRNVSFDQNAPIGLRGKRFLPLRREAPPAAASDFEQQTIENHEHISNACAWLAWHCRMDLREPASLTKFVERLSQLRADIPIAGDGVETCIAYYLQVAPAMFAFYLVLWELAFMADLDPLVQHV